MKVEATIASILAADHTRLPIIIGIEGFGGSGKSTLARDLAAGLGNTIVIGLDDFIVKEKILETSWEEAFDRTRLKEEILEPARAGRRATYRRLIWETNTLSEPVSVSKVDYLIVEGISCYHPSVERYYDYKIWVDTPIEVAKERGKRRDAGNENEQHWELWARNDIAYLQKHHPDRSADIVIDNSA